MADMAGTYEPGSNRGFFQIDAKLWAVLATHFGISMVVLLHDLPSWPFQHIVSVTTALTALILVSEVLVVALVLQERRTRLYDAVASDFNEVELELAAAKKIAARIASFRNMTPNERKSKS